MNNNYTVINQGRLYMDYQCGHCGYIGPCYGTPVVGGKISGISAPWCKCCGMNDKLKIYKDTNNSNLLENSLINSLARAGKL